MLHSDQHMLTRASRCALLSSYDMMPPTSHCSSSLTMGHTRSWNGRTSTTLWTSMDDMTLSPSTSSSLPTLSSPLLIQLGTCDDATCAGVTLSARLANAPEARAWLKANCPEPSQQTMSASTPTTPPTTLPQPTNTGPPSSGGVTHAGRRIHWPRHLEQFVLAVHWEGSYVMDTPF